MKYKVTVEGTQNPLLLLDMLYTSIELIKESIKMGGSGMISASCTVRKGVDLTFKAIEDETT